MTRSISKDTIIFLYGLHVCCTLGYSFEATLEMFVLKNVERIVIGTHSFDKQTTCFDITYSVFIKWIKCF